MYFFRLETANFSQLNELLAEVDKYYSKNADILQRFDKFMEELKKNEIESYEALAEQSMKLNAVLIELARATEPAVLPGNNFALFGLTSTGKSTIINRMLGQDVAETGHGEVTKQTRLYPGSNFFVWDNPGRNDEVSYMTMGYISMLKGLTRRVIVVQSTLKENSSLMKLMDSIGLDYDIVVNKLDLVSESAQAPFREQIDREKTKLGLKGVRNIFFVSATDTKKFPDWSRMVQDLMNSIH